MRPFMLCVVLVGASWVAVQGDAGASGPSGWGPSGGGATAPAARLAEDQLAYKLWAKNPSTPGRGWVLHAYYSTSNFQLAKNKADALRRAGWLARITNRGNQVVY
jgi:hypothetical protein